MEREIELGSTVKSEVARHVTLLNTLLNRKKQFGNSWLSTAESSQNKGSLPCRLYSPCFLNWVSKITNYLGHSVGVVGFVYFLAFIFVLVPQTHFMECFQVSA